MSNYEARIGKVVNSTFAIGENARAEAKFGSRDLGDMADALKLLRSIVSNYTDSTAYDVLELAVAASHEITANEPEKEVFRRLADATRKMMRKLGPSIVEAGALAEAVAKISDLIRHM